MGRSRTFGRMIKPPTKRTITALAAAATLFAPAAYAAEPQDLRSPDTRDAAEPQDLRSPDTRDAARSSALPPPVVPGSPRLEHATDESTGFAWGDAGIGAGATLTLLMLGSGAVLLLERHGRRQSPARTT